MWAPDYVTAEELATFMRIQDDEDEPQLAEAVTSSSRLVDKHCNRQFGQVETAEQRVYKPRYDYDEGHWVVDIDDLMDADGLVVEADGQAVTGYELGPPNAAVDSKPWTTMVLPCRARTVAVTALWGWSAVPSQVREGTFLQAARLTVRRSAPFGVAGSPDLGNELRLLARLDPDVVVLLNGLRRRRLMR